MEYGAADENRSDYGGSAPFASAVPEKAVNPLFNRLNLADRNERE
jgi:hypothetical protein